MRELTKQEKDFLRQMHEEREDHLLAFVEEEAKPRRLLFRPLLYSGLILFLGVLLTAFLIYVVMRLESLVGAKLLTTISEAPSTPESERLLKMYHLEWLTAYVKFYNQRQLIIGSVIATTFLGAFFFALWDYLLERNSHDETQED